MEDSRLLDRFILSNGSNSKIEGHRTIASETQNIHLIKTLYPSYLNAKPMRYFTLVNEAN